MGPERLFTPHTERRYVHMDIDSHNLSREVQKWQSGEGEIAFAGSGIRGCMGN